MPIEVMTPEDFKNRMDYLIASCPGDAEAFHISADNLIMTLLTQLGYKDGVEIFAKARKWYA